MARPRPLFLLDTNIASFIIRSGSPAVDAHPLGAPEGSLFISAITRAELQYGVQKKPDATRLAGLVSDFLLRVPTLPWLEETADAYGALRAALERLGKPIGNLDTLIAAHALALGAVLVTNNRKHFEQVPGLTWEDWAASD